MSLLVTCKILRQLINTSTADGKYFLLKRENLTQPNQMHLSQNKKFFLKISCIFEIYIKFWTFLKKYDPDSWCIFKITNSKTRWLDKFLKSPVLEDLSSDNIVNRPKYCFILNDSTFAVFIGHCEGNWVGKNLS